MTIAMDVADAELAAAIAPFAADFGDAAISGGGLTSFLDLLDLPKLPLGGGGGLLLDQPPATPTSASISSSSTDEFPIAAAATAGDEGEQEKSKKANGEEKKKGQKRPREPRFAFKTRSEVDHLEDGYRWRKYGQKAVKNSPFPRSYYRCTSAACGVKKRVERALDDPAVVVTTYEGKHTHPCPATVPRGSVFSVHVAGHASAPPAFAAAAPLFSRSVYLPSVPLRRASVNASGGGGLLQDVVRPEATKAEVE